MTGTNVFPLGLSAGPPLAGKTPSGSDAWSEIAAAGVNLLRVYPNWTPKNVGAQIQTTKETLDTAAAHGLRLWVGLYPLANKLDDESKQLLSQVVAALKGEPGLGAWKGADEPEHGGIPAADLVPVFDYVKQLDADHPFVLIQAPVGRGGVTLTPALLQAYTAALDVSGIDIYPVSYPPGAHAARANTDLSLVGDVTAIVAQAVAPKPVWMTLQIAWSGILPPARVPRFPSLHDERFMAYQAIVSGASGLAFFGGDLLEVMSPADAASGWNWTFWYEVLRPLLLELGSSELAPALAAPPAGTTVDADTEDVQLAAREASGFLYLIAVRRSPQLTTEVTFSGLPAAISSGEVLFEYANQKFRPVTVQNGAFRDWFAPFDAHVYRFPVAAEP